MPKNKREEKMMDNIGRCCNVVHMRVEIMPSEVAGMTTAPQEFVIVGVLRGRYMIQVRSINSFVWSIEPTKIYNIN